MAREKFPRGSRSPLSRRKNCPGGPPRDPPALSRQPASLYPSPRPSTFRPERSCVRPSFSFKDAILTPPSSLHSFSLAPQSLAPLRAATHPAHIPALPSLPPKFLLNPSLRDRCFRCFERGHRAAGCLRRRRCLLCMESNHPAARCPNARTSSRLTLEPGPSSGRRRSAEAFLPASQPSLSGCVARVEVLGCALLDAKEVISQGLASRFGGSAQDYKVADFRGSSMVIFFPNWVVRESTIGRSPLRFGNAVFRFSNWSESGEMARGHLHHMVWIRLCHWPILCWSSEDVKAAISGFGELWEVDPISERGEVVSFFRARIRCPNVQCVPELLSLTVEDRRFRIPIEVDSWEETPPILLGEDLDARLGLDSAEAQDRFIRLTGFSFVPPMGDQGENRPNLSGGAGGGTPACGRLSSSPAEMAADHRQVFYSGSRPILCSGAGKQDGSR